MERTHSGNISTGLDNKLDKDSRMIHWLWFKQQSEQYYSFSDMEITEGGKTFS